jgi:hypothetical protein
MPIFKSSLPVSLPTVTTFTSGSGQTYVPPAGALYLKIWAVGGGGGGSGAGVSAGGNGGAGGDTIFGISLVIAKGGLGGTYNGTGGFGGSYLTGASAILLAGFVGGYGSVGGAGAAGLRCPGGLGGDNPIFGGAGRCNDYNQGGDQARTNSGSGGQAGGNGAVLNCLAGSGGGAGGGLIAFVNPALFSAFSYTVGAQGGNGAAGVSGFAGATGAAGRIIVEEHYQ